MIKVFTNIISYKCVSFPENAIFQILIKVSDMPIPRNTAVIKLPFFCSADSRVRLILPFPS